MGYLGSSCMNAANQATAGLYADRNGLITQRAYPRLIAPVNDLVTVRSADPGTTVIAWLSVHVVLRSQDGRALSRARDSHGAAGGCRDRGSHRHLSGILHPLAGGIIKSFLKRNQRRRFCPRRSLTVSFWGYVPPALSQ